MFLRENEVGRRVAPHLRTGETVLDYGSGTGLISRWLVRHVGVEPTQADMVEYGNRRRDLPFLVVEGPFHLPVDDRAFETVLLLFALDRT